MYLTFSIVPFLLKHAVSDVDLLESIGWTRFDYTSFLYYLMMEAEPAVKALCVFNKNKTMEKVTFTCFNLMNTTVTYLEIYFSCGYSFHLLYYALKYFTQ